MKNYINLSKLLYRLAIHYACTIRRVIEFFKPIPLIEKPQSILVGGTVLLGDLLMQAPLIYGLRMRYPEAKITLLVPKGWQSFAKLIIGVDAALEVEMNNAKWFQIFQRQYANTWDLGVVPFVYFLVPLFYALGIKNILSFPDPKGRYRHQIHRCMPLPSHATHMSRMLLKLIEAENFQYPAPHVCTPEIALPEFLQGKRYVVIHPGASLSTRFWPSERYAAVAQQLLLNNYTIILTGAKNEKFLCDKIETLVSHVDVINFAEKTDLLLLTKILKEAAVVLGPDTGVLHLVKALAVPSVVLMGPTQKEIYGLDEHFYDTAHHEILYIADLPCRDRTTVFKHEIRGVQNCRRAKCLYSNISCMLSISVDAVLNALKELSIL